MKKIKRNLITLKPNVCGGKPCIRDTRIEAALAYAADLAHESVWRTAVPA